MLYSSRFIIQIAKSEIKKAQKHNFCAYQAKIPDYFNLSIYAFLYQKANKAGMYLRGWSAGILRQ